MKRKTKWVLMSVLAGMILMSQAMSQNSAETLMDKEGSLAIGGYGEVHYNQDINKDIRNNGKLDVHRMVMLMGYRFNERTQFVTEIEFEHVKEVYVEQAFLQYRLTSYMNLRAGLVLIPMGYTNEYHEPTNFFSVERSAIDTYIVPSTWREVGVGITGNIIPATIKYQLYLVNGFSGYNESPTLSGKNGFRKGRQKGAESFISAPNFTASVSYYGLRNLQFGIAAYTGKTQSSLYNGISRDDNSAMLLADSSVVAITMVGFNARFHRKGLSVNGQLYYVDINNTQQYNAFTDKDLGSAMAGYYVEVGYNLLQHKQSVKDELIPFVRYEYINTHQQTENTIEVNPEYKKTLITTGLAWKMAKGAVVKADIQMIKPENSNTYSTTINAGVGVMF